MSSRIKCNGGFVMMAVRNGSMLLCFCLFTIVFLPPLLYYVNETSSQAAGVCAAALVVLGAAIVAARNTEQAKEAKWNFFLAQVSSVAALTVILVLVHLWVASFLHEDTRPVAWAKSLLSLGPMTLLLVSGAIGGRCLTLAPPKIVDACSKLVTGAMLMVVIWTILGVQPESGNRTWASMFPFTEPSHFALASIPFFLYFCAITKSEHLRLFVLLGILCVLVLMNRSMVFSAGVLLIIGLTCPPRYLRTVSILFVIAHTGASPSYYGERLGFVSEEITNLSALVYRQGWELMVHEVGSSGGWGIGFQQLGTLSPDLPASRAIRAQLSGNLLNSKDGSFVMVKLVSEFGIFGLLVTLAYVAAWLKAAWLLRQQVMRRLRPDDIANSYSPNMILALSLFVGYGIDFFARGIGYFTGTAMLCVMASVYLFCERRVLLHRV